MKFRIGNRLTAEVTDFAEASRVYAALRDASGEGASTFPVGRLPGHYISYNGRVWKGAPQNWVDGISEPVYSP
jgi:hypothetical protein